MHVDCIPSDESLGYFLASLRDKKTMQLLFFRRPSLQFLNLSPQRLPPPVPPGMRNLLRFHPEAQALGGTAIQADEVEAALPTAKMVHYLEYQDVASFL